MLEKLPYQGLADGVLVLHFAVVGFVVGGLLAVVVGNRLGWRWVNRLAFRVVHLAAIGFVVLQALLGATCPLTILENWLRAQAGLDGYRSSFIEHWIQAILFHQAPAWIFVAAYSMFLAAVLASWIRYPPHVGRSAAGSGNA